MERLQSMIDKVLNCPYFQKAIELQNIPSEDYSTKWWHRCNGGTARLWLAYKSAYKHAKLFEQKGTITVGLYEFTYSLRIGLSSYLYDKGIVCRIHIHTPDRYPRELYGTNWQTAPITGSETDIHKTVYNHLLKYFWSDGVLSTIQYNRNCTKQDALYFLKEYIKARYFINNGELSEAKIQSWVLKRFNIKSYVSIKETARIVNLIGKQDETKEIFKMDFSFMDTFDGDIDEIENEMYKNNPYNNKTIYV